MRGWTIAGLSVAGVLLVILGSVGFLAYRIYQGYRSFPEYAKREVTYAKYDELLESIDDCIDTNDTALSLAACLETIEGPEELIYLSLERKVENRFSHDRERKIEIMNKCEDRRVFSETVINGSGYGSINGRRIIVIKYDVEKFDDIECCTIYLHHAMEQEETIGT
jgi:hypothetical protein